MGENGDDASTALAIGAGGEGLTIAIRIEHTLARAKSKRATLQSGDRIWRFKSWADLSNALYIPARYSRFHIFWRHFPSCRVVHVLSSALLAQTITVIVRGAGAGVSGAECGVSTSSGIGRTASCPGDCSFTLSTMRKHRQVWRHDTARQAGGEEDLRIRARA